MTATGGPRDSARAERTRQVLSVVGLALLVGVLVPPLGSWARRYEFVQSIQFCVLAYAVPALLATGAPWKWLRLASGEPLGIGEDGAVSWSSPARFMDRYALRASRRAGHTHIFTWGLVSLAVVIFWRASPVVDALVRHGWLVLIEALTLVASATPVWLAIVESPPVRPSTTRPFRIGVAAVSMWTIWIVAYLNGMSQVSWYSAFHHVPGGLSHVADQEFSAGVMWAISAAVFLPVVFWNLIHWLQSEEDPNDELGRLLRESRIRGTHDASA